MEQVNRSRVSVVEPDASLIGEHYSMFNFYDTGNASSGPLAVVRWDTKDVLLCLSDRR